MPDLFPLPVGSPFASASPAPTPMAAPAFGTPAAPVAPPAAAPMAVPPPATQAPGAPSFRQMLVPLLASVVAGRGNPAAIGAGLAAYQQGRRLKRAEREHDLDRQSQEDRERAEFYGRVVQNAQQIDDPVAFEQWKQAIAPMAQVYGVPLEGVVFSDAKRKAADQKLVQAALDQAVKRHGPEVLNREDVSVRLADGRTLSMGTARNLLGGEVLAGGAPVPVRTSTPFAANTPEEMAIAAKARELGKKPEELTLEELTAARSAGKPATAPNAGSFEAFTTETDPAKRAAILSDRKLYQQADDRPITVNTGVQQGRVDTRVDRLYASFNSAPIVKEFNEVQAQHQTIKSVVNGAWSGPGDMSIIFAFMKALDPTSVVREAEYDNAAKSGNIFTGWAARFNGAISPRGGFLSDQVKRDFLKVIETRLGAKRAQYDNLRTQTAKKIDRIRAGAPETGDEALVDYGAAFPDAPVTPAGSGGGLGSYQDYLASQKKKGGAK